MALRSLNSVEGPANTSTNNTGTPTTDQVRISCDNSNSSFCSLAATEIPHSPNNSTIESVSTTAHSLTNDHHLDTSTTTIEGTTIVNNVQSLTTATKSCTDVCQPLSNVHSPAATNVQIYTAVKPHTDVEKLGAKDSAITNVASVEILAINSKIPVLVEMPANNQSITAVQSFVSIDDSTCIVQSPTSISNHKSKIYG